MRAERRLVRGFQQCDPDNAAGFYSSREIDVFLGSDGLAVLLSWLSAGPLRDEPKTGVADLDAFVDLVRRFQTPWYEEARSRLLHDPELRDEYGDANTYVPYLPNSLSLFFNLSGLLGRPWPRVGAALA